jgi:hypothetical protein
MNKATAHAVLGAFDIAAIGACYYVVNQWSTIDGQLTSGVAAVTVQTPLGLLLLLAIVPLVHLTTLLKPSEQTKKWLNGTLVMLFVIFIFMGFVFDNRLASKIEAAGYQYCPQQSDSMTFSEFKTYLKEGEPCSDQ